MAINILVNGSRIIFSDLMWQLHLMGVFSSFSPALPPSTLLFTPASPFLILPTIPPTHHSLLVLLCTHRSLRLFSSSSSSSFFFFWCLRWEFRPLRSSFYFFILSSDSRNKQPISLYLLAFQKCLKVSLPSYPVPCYSWVVDCTTQLKYFENIYWQIAQWTMSALSTIGNRVISVFKFNRITDQFQKPEN